jgi:hypothetical protein
MWCVLICVLFVLGVDNGFYPHDSSYHQSAINQSAQQWPGVIVPGEWLFLSDKNVIDIDNDSSNNDKRQTTTTTTSS